MGSGLCEFPCNEAIHISYFRRKASAEWKNIMKKDVDKLANYILDRLNVIDSDDIPAIDLYMDQVTTFMDKHLKSGKRFEDDKILTKTMINNYAKNELLPSPEKKRYSKDHVLMLIFIYYFKNILSINDIKTLLNPISEKHFNNDTGRSLDSIYKDISKMQIDRIPSISEEIATDIDKCKELFTDCTEDEQDFLRTFALVANLSFEVYIKKQIIEAVIDNLNEHDAAAKAKAKKDAALKAQAKKEAKKESKKESKSDS